MKEASPIEAIKLDEFEFFVKRDDLLGNYLGGNKARKLEFFIQNAHKFKPNSRIISYGSAQSNALAALSVFAKQKDFTLIFVCEKISSFLKNNPCGNYAFALQNGAKIVENLDCASRKEKALHLAFDDDIFIEEGIACKEAALGFEILAYEIEKQGRALGLEFDIFLPAGTGVSALYLAKFSKFRVFTCACVGDETYLKKQMQALEPKFKFSKLTILKTARKFYFAKPYKELLSIYQRALNECGIEFSLLYDSVGLLTMLEYRHIFKRPLLYIHQGGAFGNESMLARYAYKGFYEPLTQKNGRI